jgi:hypothetical protein
MARSALTPGRLYSLLSAEFRSMRARECCACGMPMPYVSAPRDASDANWSVRQPGGCKACAALVAEIVTRAAGSYDLFDPTCEPPRPRPAQTPVS